MPRNQNATGTLEIVTNDVPATFSQQLNDRLRRIQLALSQLTSSSTSSGGGGSSTSTTGTISGELILTVPGTLAVESNAAPALILPANTSFSTITLLVKQAPQGAPIEAQLYVAGAAWGPVLSIAENTTQASFTLSAPTPIAANALIRLDITQVGATLTGQSFPGSDLTVMLW